MGKWIGVLVAVVALVFCGWVIVKSLRRKPFTSIRGGGGGGGDEQPPPEQLGGEADVRCAADVVLLLLVGTPDLCVWDQR